MSGRCELDMGAEGANAGQAVEVWLELLVGDGIAAETTGGVE